MEIVANTWLTRQQIRLLCVLMRNSPMVVTHQQLITTITGDAEEVAATSLILRVAIAKLRDALDCYGYRPCVVTVKRLGCKKGLGYKWDGALRED